MFLGLTTWQVLRVRLLVQPLNHARTLELGSILHLAVATRITGNTFAKMLILRDPTPSPPVLKTTLFIALKPRVP